MAAPPLKTDYQYTSLPSPTSIRLLRILSGVDEEPIRCSLEVVDLAHEPRYDCLSYTWGDPLYRELYASQELRQTMSADRLIPMDCDGRVILITRNLRDALLQLIRNGPSSSNGIHPSFQRQERIWVDAVCINQTSKQEKSVQVAMMDRIYYKAQTVIVWLGVDDVHVENAIYVMGRLAAVPPEKLQKEIPEDLVDPETEELLGTFIESYEWLDLGGFLRRTWFSRIWVVQETFFAQNIIVFCGSYILSWNDITSASRTLRNSKLGTLLEYKVESTLPSSSTTRDVGNKINNQHIFQNLREKSEFLNLEMLLKYSKYFNATNPRDHVYAVLGMRDPPWKSKVAPRDIVPNYEIGVENVFTDASWIIIKEMRNLNILSLVDPQVVGRKAGITLPSWVPDFSATPLTELMNGNSTTPQSEQRWNASDGLTWEMPAQVHSERLPVSGFPVDIIIEFAGDIGQYQITALLSFLEDYLKQHPAGGGAESSVETFWRTLIKDTFRGLPAGEDARLAFPLLLILFISDIDDEIEINKEKIQLQCDNPDARQQVKELTALYSQTETILSNLLRNEKISSDIIPTWSHAQEIISMAQNNTLSSAVKYASDYIKASFHSAYAGRRLFRTTDMNYLGLGPQNLQKGDTVWVIAGMAVPVILRPSVTKGRWILVGEAYVHGMMNGEAVRLNGGDEKVQMIELE